MPFELNQIADYKFDPARVDRTVFDALMASSRFENRKDAFAIISYGGTISSGYVPELETILPSLDNKGLELMTELKKLWAIVSTEYTGISLSAKDSRQVTAKDVTLLLDFINLIENQRILVTAGTYLSPLFAQAIDLHIKGSRVIGVTGSMLTDTHNANDVGVNISGAVTAINLLAQHNDAEGSPQVFLSFHGEVFAGEQLKSADLHPKQGTRTVMRGVQVRPPFPS